MSSIVEACHSNRLPSVSLLCDYGLDGRDGINPIVLFELYKTAVLLKKITGDQLEHAMKTDTLKKIVGLDVKSGYGKGYS